MRKEENRNYKQRLVKGFKLLMHQKSPYKVWSDLMLLYAVEIANTTIRPLKDMEPFKSIWNEREKQYIETIKTYNKKEQKIISQIFTMLVMELEENPCQDLLGEIYMMLEISNKNNGQFFTPYSVCDLMSAVTIDRKTLGKQLKKNGYVTISDCSCGGGATLISAVERCKEMFKKLNYQNHIMVVGQDIDITCVHMSYIQFSLHGIAGYVSLGNTLTELAVKDLHRIWFTPMYFSDIWTMRRLFNNQDILGRGRKK